MGGKGSADNNCDGGGGCFGELLVGLKKKKTHTHIHTHTLLSVPSLYSLMLLFVCTVCVCFVRLPNVFTKRVYRVYLRFTTVWP